MKKLSLSTSNNIKQNNSLPFSKRYSTDYTINEDPYESFDYHNDKNNLQSIDQILINDGKSLSCSNKKCIETAEEVEQLTEECNDLEQKCILIDYSRSEELLNLSDKISLISSNVQNLIDSIEIYEGDSLDNLQYENLTKIEINLLNLLIKVESCIINGYLENDQFKCGLCQLVEINCVIKPCNHACICVKCAEKTIKCPLCQKFIEYFEKIFLPSN